MSFFKFLGAAAGLALAPVTGGSSLVLAGAGFAAGGAIDAGIAANKAAGAADDYNATVFRLQEQYRRDVMDYQNTSFAQEIDFYNKQIAWQKDEFGKNKARVEDTITAVDQNMFSQLGTQMVKIVEQDMAEALGIIDTNAQVRRETGSLEASMADSGVGGNVSNMLRGDVLRQGGAAKTAIGMNAASARRQSTLEMQGIKASRDTQLSQLTIPTFQPMQAPSAPAPVNPVNPSAPSQRLSAGTIALNAISSGINLGVGASTLIKNLP